ncbi:MULTISPECIES: riboflavin synthase [Stomatobaculum]|jgi:riboflavin synthase, alpha subunit|uniref:riboflavin synthase n=1 Tax=Stomatobaculum TaxID=1213720 RepID=UPI002729E690|nr:MULTISPECIES: riboflavin synthase [Stomatobaculum]WLD86616.1 riboflavin synthase [Stomatobaculum sp. F0698]
MFTGLIEEQGRVLTPPRNGKLSLAASKVTEGLALGDSIAVNGVCLTVSAFSGQRFTADVMPETLHRSNLGELRTGSLVNLERALPATGRFGGHFVSGHIDGVGSLLSVRPEGNALIFSIRAAPELLRGIVEKGSVAIDGISLTVVEVTETLFSVSVIPHTAAVTTLAGKRPGDRLNLETDMIGKYVLRALSLSQSSNNTSVNESLLRALAY